MKYATSAISFALSFLSLSTIVQSCGRFQFYHWWDLPDSVWNASKALGYNMATWEIPFTNPIEFVAFKNVFTNATITTPAGDINPSTVDAVSALTALDLYKDDAGKCWDYLVNHYQGYSFADLQNATNPLGDNLAELVTLLGWNQTTWDLALTASNATFSVPISACLPWYALGPAEKYALTGLGWDRKSWDWAPCDVRCEPSLYCA